MAAILEAIHAHKVFGGGILDATTTVAVDDFSLTFDDAQPSITAVVGESGSGKTTIARLMLGFEQPTSGEIRYRGTALTALDGTDWRNFRTDVQAVFQAPFQVYNPFYRIAHVLKVPIDRFGLAKSRRARDAIIEGVLTTVGLQPSEVLGRHPHQLSGGQRQRIMVARALVVNPKVIIADEPVSMIDASLRATVLTTLRKLNRESGISILYITHDLATAYQISDRIIVLYAGKVVETGPVETVIKQPKHPYSQLLINAVPQPDPDRKWQVAKNPALAVQPGDTRKGCPFVARCSQALPACVDVVPELQETDAKRWVACHLYDEQAVGAETL